MKIATLNINNVNNRLTNLLEWLARTKPDVVCLQELKATDRDFPKAAIERPVTEWPGVGKNPGCPQSVSNRARGVEPGPIP